VKAVLAIILAGITTTLVHAGEPEELQALEAKYARTQSDLATDPESNRAHYVMELARLRFRMASEGDPDWQAVDREIIRHPVPADANPAILAHLRLGQWHSSRHDYLFESDGTWRMNDDPETTTHGTWSIRGAQYSEMFVGDEGASARTFTLILVDSENFIFTDGTHLLFETRTLGTGLPIRRDEQEN
jgi:hypothetical protein